MADTLDEKTTNEHKPFETRSSTATSESSQIEDVEIINADDEEQSEGDGDKTDEQEEPKSKTSETDDKSEEPATNEIPEVDDPNVIAELANSIADLSEEQKDELFTEEQRQFTISNFIIFSALLFIVPLSLMYGSYRFIFQDMYNFSTSDSALYGGIVGVCAVYAIIAAFIYVAYGEEKDLEKRYKEIKKDKKE